CPRRPARAALPSFPTRRASDLSGPIFERQVVFAAPDQMVDLPVVRGGFAAVEAEFVLRIGRDQDADKRVWSAADAVEMIGAVHIDRKSTRLNSSHVKISYAVFC